MRQDGFLPFLSAFVAAMTAAFVVGLMLGFSGQTRDFDFMWAVDPVVIADLGDGEAFTNDVLVVRDNLGGTVHTYTRRWQAVTQMGMRVIVDGECSSACTHVLFQVPRERVCITENARFGFHLARELVSRTPLPDFSAAIDRRYPALVRAWLATQAPLTVENTVYIPFGVINSHYRRCDETPPVFIHYEDEQ